MKKIFFASALALSLTAAWSDAALATVRTISLSVPGMNCEVCPITVRKALEKIPGVSKVNVSFEKKEANVTFDDVKTNIQALENATLAAGYKSTAKQ